MEYRIWSLSHLDFIGHWDLEIWDFIVYCFRNSRAFLTTSPGVMFDFKI